MSINFNSNYNFNIKPLPNESGFSAVDEQNLETTQHIPTRQNPDQTTELTSNLDNISDFNKAMTQVNGMDSQSETAVSTFESVVQSYDFTPQELVTLYRQFDLQISNLAPEAKQRLDVALHGALFKAFTPVVTMDSQSENAIANFKSTIDASLTKNEMIELFTRFSREISINYPEAWKELEGVLSNNLSNAHVTDNTMDAQSENAISNLRSSLNASMTKDEMVELFVRFSREVSVNYPQAWNELEGVLANNLASAYVPDTSIDSQSESAISNFKSSINESLTKDEMVELFTRFSREISVKFPKAWKELESVLSNMLPNAFTVDTSMDDQSRNAISNFKSSINEGLTKDEMIELFTRFSREISINYPEAWKDLESVLAQEVPNAFKPVTTIDEYSKDLATEFVNRVNLEELSSEELEGLFGDYAKQISLKFVDAKKEIETAYQNKTNEAVRTDKQEYKTFEEGDDLVKFFKQLSQKVDKLDEKVRDLGFDLANAENKNEIQEKLQDINKVEGEKEAYDSQYKGIIKNIFENKVANNNFTDDYTYNLDVSKKRPADKKLQQKEMKQLTRWDMLRDMRRKEVLGILNDKKKDDLIEQLTSVPKFILKRILLNQVHDDQCKILMSQRYPEALLRDIPKHNAKKQLPKAEDMLPVLMMTGKLSSGETGMGLIRKTLTGDFDVEKAPNPTRTKEEIVPFIADMLLNKPPKASEVLKSTANIGKPKPASFHKMVKEDVHNLASKNPELVGNFFGLDPKKAEEQSAGRRDNKIDMSKENKNRLPRLELLSIGQLLELANDKVTEFTDDEAKDTLRAKRGTNKELSELLESLDGVNSLASAKIAISVLYNHQQQLLKQAVIPHMNEADMVKISLMHGKSKEQMVKDMPWYTIQDQLKELPKVQMMDSFKLLDKSEIIGAFKQLPSQTVASIAYDAVDRTTVSENLLNKKGFASA